MQIKKSKGVVSVKLTQFERRQLEGAKEITDTILTLGGKIEDLEALVTGNGTITIGANSDDKETEKKPQGASSESKKVG